MQPKATRQAFILRIRPVEEFSGASTANSPQQLFEPRTRLRKFSGKPVLPSEVTQSNDSWKINREQDEFFFDSPLRMLCGYSSYQVNFVTLKTSSVSKCISNSITVPIRSSKSLDGFYQYAKNILHPTLHNMTIEESQIQFLTNNDNWKYFSEINEDYAQSIVPHLKPNDFVLIVDYELILVPHFLGKHSNHSNVGFMFKTPFPSSELFRCIPQRKEILESLVSCSLVNFSTPSYGRHFLSACTRILGAETDGTIVDWNGKSCRLTYEEFTLDTKYIDDILNLKIIENKISQIKEYFNGKQIIFGIDGLSQQAAVFHKLKAIGELLSKYPQYKGTMSFVQICYPEDYIGNARDARITELVSSINSTYGTIDNPIVHYFEQNIDFDEYFALICTADCYIDATESQPFNSAIFEYIYCQEKTKKSPLIISEMSQFSKSLPGGIQCNPWDHECFAESIHYALTMPEEESEQRHLADFKYVSDKGKGNIFVSLLQRMQAIASLEAERGLFLNFSPEVFEKFNFHAFSKRLFILDYDGTLVPIKKTPNDARPDQFVTNVLTKLASNPKNIVFVVSGRDKDTLVKWLGNIPYLGLSAEHGNFVKFPEKLNWLDLSNTMDSMDWKSSAIEILTYFTERTPGSFIEQKQLSIVWHYRLADPEFGSRQAKECQLNLEASLLSKYPVEILLGKKVIEVRSSFCNKGVCVNSIIHYYNQLDCIVCAGDDKTDEDMFRVLETKTSNLPSNFIALFTCIVGSAVQRSVAKYRTKSPESLLQILLTLTEQ